MEYLKDNYTLTQFTWSDTGKKLTIQAGKTGKQIHEKIYKVELIPQGITKEVTYSGNSVQVLF